MQRQPILSVNRLAALVGASAQRLKNIAENINSHYTEVSLWQTSSKLRVLRIPSVELKEIQRAIKRHILDPYDLGPSAHGGVKGRSPLSNARCHLNQPCVVNLDVKTFFEDVRHYMVLRLFRKELRFGRDVARLLTRLTTLDGQLPQGAPTSTSLANLLLRSVDQIIETRARSSGVSYSRFVDDVTLSGENPRALINSVARALSTKRLRIHRSQPKFSSKVKLSVKSARSPQEVTGLVVNSPLGPSVSKKRRDAVRAEIHQLGKEDPAVRAFRLPSIKGKIAHVRRYNPGTARRLERLLDRALS